MQWQDVVIAVGSWASTAALIPSLIGEDKPAVSSSIFTGALVATFGVCYFTLEFWSAALAAGVLSLAWFTLAFQQWRRKRRGMLK